jgi:DNA repair exonuclease SbcCD ATPase subunit
MSDDNERADIRADNERDDIEGHIENNENIEIPSPTTEPMSEEYVCNICGRSFSSAVSLKMHKIKVHRQSEYSRGEPTPNIQPMESPIPDLLADLKNIKSAVEFARWRDRLKMQAPDLYRVFFPTPKSEASEDATSKLVNLEVFRLLRQIREEMEASRPNQPNSNDSALTALQSQLENYRQELSRLREELHKKEMEVYQRDIQHLNSAIEDLKRQIENARLATSDFAVLIKEVKDLGEKWLKFSGGPLVELLMNSLGYVKLPSEKLITKEAEKAEESLIELFEQKGWITEG